MRCSDVTPRLPAYQDGDVPPRLGAAIAGHLAACAPCAERLGRLESAVDALRRQPDEPRPAGFEHRLKRRIATAQATGRGTALRWAAAAAVLVVAAVGSWLWLGSADPPPAADPSYWAGYDVETTTALQAVACLEPLSREECTIEIACLDPFDCGAYRSPAPVRPAPEVLLAVRRR